MNKILIRTLSLAALVGMAALSTKEVRAEGSFEAAKAGPSALAQAQALANALGAAPQTPQAAPPSVSAKPAYGSRALAEIVEGLKDERILNEIAEESRIRGQVPVVVFDIDDTLFDSSYRDMRILKELSGDPGFRQQFPNEADVIAGVRVEDSQGRYNVLDVANALGITNQAALDAIKAYWLPRFFSDDYVLADQPIPGGAQYIQKVVQTGAVVVYLTGRGDPAMRKGTEESLAKHGFPLPDGNKVILLMKADKNEKDAAYKDRVLTEVVDKSGKVVASFENEPKNLNIFARRYPGCALVLLDTKHSPAPDQPNPTAVWIKDFNN